MEKKGFEIVATEIWSIITKHGRNVFVVATRVDGDLLDVPEPKSNRRFPIGWTVIVYRLMIYRKMELDKIQ